MLTKVEAPMLPQGPKGAMKTESLFTLELPSLTVLPPRATTKM